MNSSHPLRLCATLAAAAALSACASVGPRDGTGRGEATRQGAQSPRSAYGLFLAGEAALRDGRAEEAAALFRRARVSAPENDVLRARVFKAALSAGEVERAAAIAPSLTPADGPVADLARVTRAVDALAQGRARDAFTLLNQGGSRAPHGLAVEVLKPWAAAAEGDYATALAPARPLAGAPAAGAGEQVVPLLLLAQTLNQAGRLALLERAGRFAEADGLARGFDVADAPIGQVLKHGTYLERRRRPAEAAALYERALAPRPGDRALTAALQRARAGRTPPALPSLRQGAAEALLAPAVAFAGGRQYDTALAYLRLALHLDPKLDEAWIVLGDVLGASGDADGARRAYLTLKPGSEAFAASRARLSFALNEAGRTSEALQVIRTAAAAAPDDAAVLVAYAALLNEAERFGEAAAVFDRRLATPAGSRDWRLWYLRASALERAGRWPEAERDFQRALSLAPDEPEVLNGLGYSWIDRGLRLRQALAMVERAARLRPQSGAIVDSLGWAHYRLGNAAEAVTHLERAVELEPGDPTINDHLGDAYWRTGRRIEAGYQWTRALTLEPDAKLKAALELKLRSGAGPDAARSAARIQAPVPSAPPLRTP